MLPLRSGKSEGFPYSLSRWTDVPASKWPWFLECLDHKEMVGFSPLDAAPDRWSLRPEDTLGLVFWTKDPTNLIFDARRLESYRVKVHVTVTGWEEVERGAPDLLEGAGKLGLAAGIFGPENVTWRFSPVPIVTDVVDRFERILMLASEARVGSVYLSFLQENDDLPETRSDGERLNILVQVAEKAKSKGVKVYLCNEDRLLFKHPGAYENLSSGVCAPPEDFALPGRDLPSAEGCGCVLMVDPFTVNESCSMGCLYCYAGMRELSPKKHDTVKGVRRLMVVG